jgi:low temperature requirement protein LtrA
MGLGAVPLGAAISMSGGGAAASGSRVGRRSRRNCDHHGVESATSKPQAREDRVPATATEEEERVTPLELFFDVVFVFAITQVTSLMAHHPTSEGVGQGLLVLAAIWWAWAAYSWLTNTIDPDEDLARIAMFAAMTAMFIVALAVPGAFGNHGVLFACAYLVVRVLHIVVYAYASPTVHIRAAVARLVPGVTLACGLLIVAGTQDGVVQAGLWCAALLFDYTAPLWGTQAWAVHPSHFVERYGLIVIIALGESIVAIGLGLNHTSLDAGQLAAAALGLLLAASLWWAYFDVVAIAAERKLRSLDGLEQAHMARDSYSYLHLPMIAGIVLLAFGVKKVVGDVHSPLETVPAVGLCGGVALYLAAHVAIRLRNMGTLNRHRTLAATACLAMIPVALNADALLALGAVTGICAALILFEAIRFREARERIRSGGLPESMMAR